MLLLAWAAVATLPTAGTRAGVLGRSILTFGILRLYLRPMGNATSKLFDTFRLGAIELSTRTVMAPMTRSRATADHVPTPIMVEYYRQRSGAGLIITEGVAPSPNGVGYPRIPGIYNTEQVEAWKPIAEAVHRADGRIFMQLMHTGRISHPLNMPEGSQVLAPSAVAAAQTEMYTDQEGNKDLPTPRAMTTADIQHAIGEYVTAARNAIAAGFDGVELHGANGYLIEQFINPAANRRSDAYGGSARKRTQFAVEVARAVVDAIGADRVGIRLSPGGVANDLVPFDDQQETYHILAGKLREIGVVYVHIVDQSAMGAPEVPLDLKTMIRDTFGGTIILSGGYDKARAEADLESGLGHLVAFGRPFLANPDLVERMKRDAALNELDTATMYTPGEAGYLDYPVL